MSSETALKSSRKACHEARDLFFACADANGEDTKKCRTELKNFEKNCPASWVAHFIRKHKFDKYKEELAKEGYLSPKDVENSQ
uniref:PRORP domain-containing protein n=1 Tax=Panagrolaimus sp. JU765 TaxID=591449 RepID=A0AC34PUW1_9BILA